MMSKTAPWSVRDASNMKPLNQQNSKLLMERIDRAVDSELRSIAVPGPDTMQLRISVQDRNRGFDWIDIIFEVNGIDNAKLVDDKHLAYIDMSEGISLIFNEGRIGLGVGSYHSIDALESSPLFICGNSIKFAEAEFSS